MNLFCEYTRMVFNFLLHEFYGKSEMESWLDINHFLTVLNALLQ